MAFTKAPTQDTYSSVRLPLIQDIAFEGNSTASVTNPAATSAFDAAPVFDGAALINLLPVSKKAADSEKQWTLENRPGIWANMVATGTRPRGGYVWEKSVGTTYFFCVVANKIYTSTDQETWTNVTTFTDAAGTEPCGFCEFITDTGTKYLIVVDGKEGYVFTSNAAGTKITDADFPNPHVPSPVFIDGYLFLAKKNTGDIYNSNLNDPTAWTAGSFISSELYPDDVQYLVKVNNYLLAIGFSGCEYFYDAANATGSPLARYEGGSLPFGTQIPRSVASNANTVAFLATNNDGGLSVKAIEDFKHKDITPSWLPKLLAFASSNLGNTFTINGFFVREAGELLYILSINSNGASDCAIVYHFGLGIWMFWGTDGSENSYFPVDAFSGSATMAFSFVIGTYSTYCYFGFLYGGQDRFTVSGVPTSTGVFSRIQFPFLDFGTNNLKFMHRLSIGYELPNGSPYSIPSYCWDEIKVRWLDGPMWAHGRSGQSTIPVHAPNDGQETWEYPCVTQLGSFRRRSVCVEYRGPIQYHFIEVDINKGQQ